MTSIISASSYDWKILNLPAQRDIVDQIVLACVRYFINDLDHAVLHVRETGLRHEHRNVMLNSDLLRKLLLLQPRFDVFVAGVIRHAA